MESPWWIRHPDALTAETAALDASGYLWTRDEAEWASGRLVLHVDVPYGAEKLKLHAEYPPTFPYFPPHAALSTVVFPRHQHLVGKNLCLLAREGADWQPGIDTLAVLLDEQFPKLLRVTAADASPELVASEEDHVGEPFSSFLTYSQGSSVIVPDETPAAQHAKGRLALDVRRASGDAEFRGGIVRKISDITGTTLISFPVETPVFGQHMPGFWLRLEKRPDMPENGAEYFYQLMCAQVPEFQRAMNSATRGQTIIAGFVYSDEVSWRDNADDWFFIAATVRQQQKRSKGGSVHLQFIRADWGGKQAVFRRAPFLLPLTTKKVLLIGLGSLGSPVGIHLARAGIGKLDLVDYDDLQAGNTIRWALGWQFAAFHKAGALAAYISRDYPYTKVQGHHIRIGANYPAGTESDYEQIRALSENADLIIDASANQRVSHFLADLARELEKPYLWLTTTHGAAGGIVGRVIGAEGACWHCFQYGLGDNSIHLPKDSGAAEVQPGGCSQPTFIGAGIDSDEIALLAARLAIATLSAGERNGYQDFPWNAAVADLKSDEHSIAPNWTIYSYPKHSHCRACNP
jgi:ubiquitin-protein ligase